ncbi:MAG: glycoside hydrolase family 127 protein, partial [Oscillospiraceae bacterium]|nr:glycoside hydrolase family 127 protein [Oscillospiraceae bacterium]
VDFALMAQKALNYLKNNPDPENGYECRFSFTPLGPWPHRPDIKTHPLYTDPISIGDTENRNDIAFNMMRRIYPSEDGRAEQEAVHKRLVSYIHTGGDFGGMCWNKGYCTGIPGDEDHPSLWSTGKLLQSECDRYIDGQTDSLDVMRVLFLGIADCAARENGYAYFPDGGLCFDVENHKSIGGYQGHYPPVMSSLCEYYNITADPECFLLLTELAEGFVSDKTPHHLHREDGGINGHNHLQLHDVRGMAQFAYMTGNARYTEWVREIYDFYRLWALDTGWLPEIRDLNEHSNHSETCLNADMLEVELWLALSGYTNLFDRIDRSMRNYFAPALFELTPEFEAAYREIHKNAESGAIEGALAFLRGMEGGYISALSPNSKVFYLPKEMNHFGRVDMEPENRNMFFDMMGCCPPEGMRAIYYAWKYAVQNTGGGVYINLPYSVETPEAGVVSGLPEEGRLDVTAKKEGAYYIRVPAWTQKENVAAYVNGEATAVRWGGASNAYVAFGGVRAGDCLAVTYPLAEFWQSVSVQPHGQPAAKYRYHWVGGTVVGVEPEGEFLPLYGGTVY